MIGVVMTRMVLKWMNTPENLLPDSTLYVRIYFAGLLFIFVYNMGAAILRAIGDSETSALFSDRLLHRQYYSGSGAGAWI